MKKEEFDFILNAGEDQFVEFKESFDKSLAKEIVAFANAKGGKIYLGVTDKGIVKGIQITNGLKSKITDLAKNCDPLIKVNLSKYNNILIINISEGVNKPYSCSKGFFLRLGPNSQKLTRDEIFEFSFAQGRVFFDEQINENFSYPNDFSKERLLEYLKEAKLSTSITNESILINLGIGQKQKGKIKLNNAGVLFFAKSPGKFFQTCKVVCAEYASNEKVDILDRKIYDDGILANIIQSINFLKKKISVVFEIKSTRRKELPQFPENAYREAVVNAIMHRDYFDKTSDIMIENYKNKLIIFNPGGLVKWMKPEEFGKISKTRNPVIASLLARTSYVEKMGTGIERIEVTMREYHLPKPQFEYYENSFYVELQDSNYIDSQKQLQKEDGILIGTVNDTLIDTVNDTQKLNKIQEQIYKEIKRNPDITYNGLVSRIKKSRRTIIRHTTILKELCFIRRIGSDKSGHWKILK